MFFINQTSRLIVSTGRLSKYGIPPCVLDFNKRNAGHSKWANIKHTKALKDNQRAATFSKLGRLMRVAIQEGGSHDPSNNIQLTQVMQQAKRNNMPSATIQSIIKSAQTSKEALNPAILEFRGPGGCIIIADILTENFQKTRQTITNILRRNNVVYSDGLSRHLFDLKGVVEAVPSTPNCFTCEEAVEHAIEAGAEDVVEVTLDQGKTFFRFLCATEVAHDVKVKLQKLNYSIEGVAQEFIPHTLVELNDVDLESVAHLYDKLQANPDIIKLYDNIA